MLALGATAGFAGGAWQLVGCSTETKPTFTMRTMKLVNSNSSPFVCMLFFFHRVDRGHPAGCTLQDGRVAAQRGSMGGKWETHCGLHWAVLQSAT